MRIHSNDLSAQDIYQAARTAKADAIDCTWVGSRKREHAFEVTLSGVSKSMTQRYRGVRAATYSQWGYFLAELFKIDPNAVAGEYNGADGFHEATRRNFVSGVYSAASDPRSAKQFR